MHASRTARTVGASSTTCLNYSYPLTRICLAFQSRLRLVGRNYKQWSGHHWPLSSANKIPLTAEKIGRECGRLGSTRLANSLLGSSSRFKLASYAALPQQLVSPFCKQMRYIYIYIYIICLLAFFLSPSQKSAFGVFAGQIRALKKFSWQSRARSSEATGTRRRKWARICGNQQTAEREKEKDSRALGANLMQKLIYLLRPTTANASAFSAALRGATPPNCGASFASLH